MPTDSSGTWRKTALTTTRALDRAAAAVGLAMAGLLAAPLALAHDTPMPQPEGGSAYVSVSAGFTHSCGLKVDGSVACWGQNSYGQAADQPGPYLSVSAGIYHSCGLKADGSVDCWGATSNNYGQVADQAGPFVSVSAGRYHSCGLKVDGSVYCWGGSSGYNFGQVADQAGPFVSVSAGHYHSCGLKVDGSVDCWGIDGYGQATDQAGPFVSVSAGLRHSCGLKVDGSVACWGGGGTNFGQITVPAGMSAPVSAGFGQIAAGNAHACQVKPDGRPACWGNNDEGQATAPGGLFNQVVAGDSHSCAIGNDSKVTCWANKAAENNARFGSDTFRRLGLAMSALSCALRLGSEDLWCYDPRTSGAQRGASYWADATVTLGGNQMCWVNRSSGAPGTCWYPAICMRTPVAHSQDLGGSLKPASLMLVA